MRLALVVLLSGVVPAQADPKAPQEVADLAKILTGTWKCAGTSTAVGGTEDMPVTGVLKVKADLDGYFLRETVDAKIGKTKLKYEAFMTYDGKKWRRAVFDNTGGQVIGSSDGMKDGKMDFNLDVMSGILSGAQSRLHVDATDPKVVAFTTEISMNKGKTWAKTHEMTCKK